MQLMTRFVPSFRSPGRRLKLAPDLRILLFAWIRFDHDRGDTGFFHAEIAGCLLGYIDDAVGPGWSSVIDPHVD
jgi:hypothetical protein